MINTSVTAWLQLHQAFTLRSSLWIDNFATFGNLARLIHAPRAQLEALSLSPALIQKLLHPNHQLIEQQLKWAELPNHHIITWEDPRYPESLRQIAGPPMLLFCIGDPQWLSQLQIAIVGSRHPSAMGRENAFAFAQALCEHHYLVTSGLALGIDGYAHRGALATTLGRTIAVLGSGLECIYPKAHLSLAQDIAGRGVVISEYSPWESVKPYHFPRRNRIISGLSVGTLVVEAAQNSGSLITAHCAISQNREVFAIPGSIHHPLSKGCHDLLKQGAKLVESVQDILSEFGTHSTPAAINNPMPSSTVIESSLQIILDSVENTTTSLQLIEDRTGISAQKLCPKLLSLELQGYISAVPGGYCRSKMPKCEPLIDRSNGDDERFHA